jgi:hypothetical protein
MMISQILNFLDVKLGNEWIDDLAVAVDLSSMLKLCSQMQLAADLEFLVDKVIDPFFVHVGPHGVSIQFMNQAFILKVELINETNFFGSIIIDLLSIDH